MSADPLSPIAPARVKALAVPVGQIKRERFAAFVDRLNREQVVHLRDISADGRPNRNMFSPLAFPNGAMFYELMTHAPSPSHLALAPFDLYREPLALIAIADGTELGNSVYSKRQSGGKTVTEANIRSLVQDLEELRDTYPKILVHQVLIFDYVASKDNAVPIPEGLVTIPPPEMHKRTTMKTVMCDISSLVLAEMTTLAKSFEAMSYIDSPGTASAVRPLNGMSPTGESPGPLSRRNSQYSLPANARSSSASGLADRGNKRVSMPPVPYGSAQFGSSHSTPARPSTPVNGRSALANPPTTFEGIQGINSDPASPEQNYPSRPETAEGFRTQSQDRVSVQGFGPGGLNERWRNKGKSRVQIIMGSLYLQAGRWGDAIKELVDGATVAKSINDHLWHGKALELTLISLLLLGWADLEFQVPTVLLPQTDKGTPVALPNNEAESKDPKQSRWMRNLQNVIPDLLERILALYSRISAEHLPPLPFAEATIRFGKLLTALHLCDGQLGTKSLEIMVSGNVPETPLTTSPRFTIIPNRTQIVAMLFRAFPASPAEVLTTVDRIVILSGIASVLGTLGFQRKKAMVIQELVQILIDGLVEARTRGAADMGIHPAAGLVALNGINGNMNGTGSLELGEGDMVEGLDMFMALLLKTYGVVTYDMSPTPGSREAALAALVDNSDAATLARIRKQSAARFFGMPNVKLNILRECIKFAEALPDFEGVLKFSSDLLRTAGSGMAPGPRKEDVYPTIPREEQVRMVTSISKTWSLANRLGLNLAAEYWDEFILRGVRLDPVSASKTPIPHAKSILPDVTATRASQDVNPFIYNPFLKQPDKADVEKILVAGELATFRITLQNPYEVEVDIESLRLDTEGVDFNSTVESTIIGPYRTQVLKIFGTPKSDGPLKITGAIIKIRGCRERRFSIFPEPWAPECSEKIKAIGLGALDKTISSPTPAAQPLKAEHLELSVIAQQPVVVIKSSTLPQSSVMILEGERQGFSVTLQNLSTTTPVDFLLFSFQDSTQEPLQAALNNRDATAAELYEYELILARKQALRLRKRDDDHDDRKRFIGPGETATFDFEILGKPGLTNGLIQIDYAHLGCPHDEVGEKFFTRQVSLELTITVNASVEIARMDVLPLHGSIPRPLWLRSGHEDGKGEEDLRELTEDKYCLLLLDLRNAWPSHMLVRLEVAGDDKGKDGPPAIVEERILPGNTSRVILPLRRVHLDDPHAFIPALNPSRQRQFVVSATKISPDVERANREAFWYREKVLDMLKGTWTATASSSSTMASAAARHGVLELMRGIRLTSRMVEALKVDEVSIDITVEPLTGSPSSSSSPPDPDTINNSSNATTKTHEIQTDSFIQLRVRITNRTSAPIVPTLRLMPALRHRPLNVALDFTRKLAWNGVLQRQLPDPPLAGGGASVEVVMGLTALCRGEFEFTGSVEETRLWEERPDTGAGVDSAEGGKANGRGNRPRSDTQLMMDAVLGKRERRIWHTRRPCCVVVRDAEE